MVHCWLLVDRSIAADTERKRDPNDRLKRKRDSTSAFQPSAVPRGRPSPNIDQEVRVTWIAQSSRPQVALRLGKLTESVAEARENLRQSAINQVRRCACIDVLICRRRARGSSRFSAVRCASVTVLAVALGSRQSAAKGAEPVQSASRST